MRVSQFVGIAPVVFMSGLFEGPKDRSAIPEQKEDFILEYRQLFLAAFCVRGR